MNSTRRHPHSPTISIALNTCVRLIILLMQTKHNLYKPVQTPTSSGPNPHSLNCHTMARQPCQNSHNPMTNNANMHRR